MRTITLAEFIDEIENGDLKWPPIEIGGFIYSKETHYEDRIREVVRAPL